MNIFYSSVMSLTGMGLSWILWHWFKKPEVFARAFPRILIVLVSSSLSFLLTSISLTPYLIHFYGLKELFFNAFTVILLMPLSIVLGWFFVWSDNRKSKFGKKKNMTTPTLPLPQYIENVLTIAMSSVLQGQASAVRIRFIADNVRQQPIWLEFDALPAANVGASNPPPEYWLRTTDPESLFGQNRSFSQQDCYASKLIEPAKLYLLLQLASKSSIEVTYKFRWSDKSPESEVRSQWP